MFRLGVAGLGLGLYHAENILKHSANWQLTAVCDTLGDRVHRFTGMRPTVQGFTDYAAFLAHSEIDGVILATPHDLHAPMAIQALEAGKHVLVEKPMARTADECCQMNSAARRAAKTLMIAQNWRYAPWVRAVKQVVDGGELGPLRAVRTTWLQNAVADDAIRPGNWYIISGAPFSGLRM